MFDLWIKFSIFIQKWFSMSEIMTISKKILLLLLFIITINWFFFQNINIQVVQRISFSLSKGYVSLKNPWRTIHEIKILITQKH